MHIAIPSCTFVTRGYETPTRKKAYLTFQQQTRLDPKAPFKSQSLNWDTSENEAAPPTLNPRDVLQVAFLVEQEEGRQEGLEGLQKDLKRDGRAILGQLSIEWRGAMGEKGFLTTGNLMSRKRT